MNLTPSMFKSRQKSAQKRMEAQKANIKPRNERNPKNRQTPTTSPKRSNNHVSVKNKPIRKLSIKRAAQNREYLAKRYQFLLDHPKCVVYRFLDSVEIHHKKGRLGKLLTDTRYFLAVSRPGHRQIEENPEWAKENGYSLSRLGND